MKRRITMLMICGAAAASVILFSGSAPAQKDVSNLPELNPDTTHLIQSMDGAALYKAYCATCHGTDGKGVGPMTEWLKIQSPDLTRMSIREGGKFPFARVQRIIAGQENITAGHGTREMPVWGPIFSQVTWDQDLGRMRVYNLAKYIEKMQEKR
jgi:mono/diheme cytochrome c family protein